MPYRIIQSLKYDLSISRMSMEHLDIQAGFGAAELLALTVKRVPVALHAFFSDLSGFADHCCRACWRIAFGPSVSPTGHSVVGRPQALHHVFVPDIQIPQCIPCLSTKVFAFLTGNGLSNGMMFHSSCSSCWAGTFEISNFVLWTESAHREFNRS